MIVSKDALGYASVFICLVQYIPLIYLTIVGKKKPHAVSRLIWATTFGITYAAQYVDHGGAGSWSSAVTGLLCLILTVAALRHSRAYVTRSDLMVFVAALLAIPLWMLSHDPFYAAFWATAIDLIGYVPVLRKAWHKPYEEMAQISLLSCIKQSLSMLAMERYSPTTMIYPIAIFVADFTCIFFLLWRRHAMKQLPAVPI